MSLKSRKIAPEVTAIKHIGELDGIRGIAIALVVLYHSHVPFFVVIGWSGVDLFFVLSGFLITSILLSTKSSPSYFSSFYARRMLRILPLYFIYLFVYFWVALPVAHHFGRAEAFTSSGQLWFWLYLQNWWSGSGTLWLAHFWSLGVEEQFYLAWPLLVFLLSRRALAYCSALSLVVCLLLRIIYVRLHFPPEVIHRVTVFRIDTLAIGGLVAIFVASGIRQERYKLPALLGAALLGIGLCYIPVHSKLMLTVGFTGVAIASAYLVFYAATNTGASEGFSRVLRSPLLRSLGKYSYGIYILHLPIVRWLGMEKDKIVNPYHPGKLAYGCIFALTTVIACAASYGAAWLSWNLVEKHFLHLKARFGYGASGAPQAEESREPLQRQLAPF